jgi:chaperonin GroEL
MNKKLIARGPEAQKHISEGLNLLADVVGSTLGPRGKNVLLQKAYGDPVVTKDGITVANDVYVSDPFQNEVIALIRHAASKTNDAAGDGTTTATVLTQAIYNAGLKAVEHVSPLTLRQEVISATRFALEKLQDYVRKIETEEDIIQVATIASNNDDDVGLAIAEAMALVGKDGVVVVESAPIHGVHVEAVEGLQFQETVAENLIDAFANSASEGRKVVLDNPLVLLCDGRLADKKGVARLLGNIVDGGHNTVMIVAEAFSIEVLKMLYQNHSQSRVTVCPVKSPGYGKHRTDFLEDIAVALGTKPFLGTFDNTKLEDISPHQLGSAKKIVVTTKNTTVFSAAGEKDDVKNRIDTIKDVLNSAETEYDSERARMRIATLSGGIAYVQVGGATETETKEKKDRIEDALNATKAAVDEGILPGGGVALLRVAGQLRQHLSCIADMDKRSGWLAVAEALETPIKRIASNGGLDNIPVIIDAIQKSEDTWSGWNAISNVLVDDMKEHGIVDPKKVTSSALENASSIAILLLTTESLVVNDPNQEIQQPMM